MKSLYFLLGVIWLAACQKSSSNEAYYNEPHRPQFHFSPVKGWMNDPNGLVYFEGEYHLFYQHYPDSTVWGPMHWGHAVSKDLIHWEHLPIALYPDSLGYIFSGSIVVDEKNTSGFGKPSQTPLVAIFTYHNIEYEKAGRKDRESQGIAYSLDKGRTWTKYAQNPVLPNQGAEDFRDPKVFWHEPTQRWVMPLAVGQHLEIYTSADLKKWQKTGEFGHKDGAHGGVWECPDLFPIKASDGVEKWVLIQNIGRGAVNGGSGTQYFIGHFDGKTFRNDYPPTQTLWLDYGADNYAGITWFGAPDGRRILIGWMSNWDDYATTVPTHPWRSAMTLPRELSLIKTTDGYRLAQMPVAEVVKLRVSEPQTIDIQSIVDTLVLPIQSPLQEYNFTFDLTQSKASVVGLVIYNSLNEKVVIGYDKAAQEVFVDRRQSGKTSFSSKFAQKHSAPYKAGNALTMKIFADVSSVEVFVDEGQVSFTELFFPNENFSQAKLFGQGIKKAEIYSLQSIWRP
ncbi:MAG: glycoside hydrolase family 32 protein [Runella sp.]